MSSACVMGGGFDEHPTNTSAIRPQRAWMRLHLLVISTPQAVEQRLDAKDARSIVGAVRVVHRGEEMGSLVSESLRLALSSIVT